MHPAALTRSAKHLMLLSVLLLLLSNFSFGQMRQVYLDLASNSNDINKISFYSPAQGYIASTGAPSDWVGFTSDSGHTFTKKFITLGNVDFNGYSVNLTFGFGISGVKAFSQDTLIAYGDYGLVPAILYSTNGGTTFKLVYHSQFNNLQLSTGITDMVFPQNDNIGFAVDADRILKTTNRGLTWSTIRTDPNSYFDFLEAVDNNTVFAFSTAFSNSKLLKTTNGGSAWSQVFLPFSGQIFYVNFYTATKGWLNMKDNNQDGRVYYTSNGGASWTLKNKPGITSFASNKMKFINDSTGFALSGLYEVYKTTDSGKVWQPLPRDNQFTYLGYSNNDLQVLNASQLWAGGGRDFLEISNNGGGTPLPKAFFAIDTLNVFSTGTVKLINYSKPGYQYKWIVNNNVVSNGYHATYQHVLSSNLDSIQLIVSNGISSDTLQQYQAFYVPPLPSITAFTPATGSTGTFITITGINFTDVAGVSFGGVPAASFTIVSPTKITAVVAGGATGSVTLSNVYGNFSMPGFTYIAPPTALPPVVQSFTPASGIIGTTVTITGDHFDPAASNNIVYFGAVRSQVTSSTTNQIVCAVPLGASFAPLSVLNASTNLTGYANKPFNLIFADSANFTTHSFVDSFNVTYSFNDHPKYVAAADIDGDGKPDLLNSVGYASDSIIIYRNTSAGGNFSFAPRVTAGWVPGFGSGRISLDDLDGDGKPDMVGVTNSVTASAWRNTSTPGNISFGPVLSLPAGDGSQEVAIGDLDGDGRPDLAVATFNYSKVSVLRNTSTPGNLSFSANTDYLSGASVLSVAIGDIDGDGKKDLVALNYIFTGPSTSFSYFKNQSTPGNIVLSAKTDIAVPGVSLQGREIRLADFDGDGKLDVVVVNDDKYSVFLNTSTPGNFSFAPVASYPVPSVGQGSSIGNISGDAKPDLVVGSWALRQFALFRNQSVPGAVTTDDAVILQGPYPYNTVPYSTAIADFNLDGKADIAVSASNDHILSVYKNNMGVPIQFRLCAQGYSSIVADVTGTSYQWQVDNGSGFTNAANGPVLTGATSAQLNLSAVPFSWNGYKFRCIVDGKYSSVFVMTVTNITLPTVSITSSATATVCPGTIVSFTATGTANGTNPNYRWQVNGHDIGFAGNSTTMSTNSFNDGDVVRVILSSQDACFTTHFDTSNVIVVHVAGGGLPAVSISTPTTSGCAGTFSFTATATNPGPNPVYQWKLNAVAAGTNSPNFSAQLNPGDYVNLVLDATSPGCPQNLAFSNSVYPNITAPVTPSVSISVSSTSSTTICTGDVVSFIATSSGGGNSPSYQWKKNGVNIGSNSNIYGSNNFANGDIITVVLTSSAGCTTAPTATSNSITMTVRPLVTPVVTISGNTTVNTGSPSTIATAPVNGGVFPQYQWQDSTNLHNWQNIIGAVSASISYVPATTGVKLRCQMSTTGICTSTPVVLSNTLKFTVSNPTAVGPQPSVTFGIRAFPDPVAAVLYIDSLRITDQWQSVTIGSIEGKDDLLVKNISGTSVSIDVSRLAAGLYTATLKRKKGPPAILKFVKL